MMFLVFLLIACSSFAALQDMDEGLCRRDDQFSAVDHFVSDGTLDCVSQGDGTEEIPGVTFGTGIFGQMHMKVHDWAEQTSFRRKRLIGYSVTALSAAVVCGMILFGNPINVLSAYVL